MVPLPFVFPMPCRAEPCIAPPCPAPPCLAEYSYCRT